MTGSLLEAHGVTKRFGGFTALDKVDLVVAPGERLGLIGPNGSGKSTLVNCLSGTLRNEEGSISFGGRDIGNEPPHRRVRLGLARSFQIPKPFVSMSVLDNLRIPLLFAARRHEKLTKEKVADDAMHVLRQVGLSDKAHATSGGLTQVATTNPASMADSGTVPSPSMVRPSRIAGPRLPYRAGASTFSVVDQCGYVDNRAAMRRRRTRD